VGNALALTAMPDAYAYDDIVLDSHNSALVSIGLPMFYGRRVFFGIAESFTSSTLNR
jgi:Protein of unknown function (DUF3443)